MGVIFDTSIWVGLSTGRIEEAAIIPHAGDQPVFTSVISLGELAFGVQSCADPADRALRAAFLRQVESKAILEVTEDTAAAWGVLAASAKAAGRSPRPRSNDFWIAAQAIEHNYLLLTANPGDFMHLPGLRVTSIA